MAARQWPNVSDFVARFCTLCDCESKNLRPCENRTRFSHGTDGSRFFDSRNVQKSVTQIIYLGPLPRGCPSLLLSVPRSPMRRGPGWRWLPAAGCSLPPDAMLPLHRCPLGMCIPRSESLTVTFHRIGPLPRGGKPAARRRRQTGRLRPRRSQRPTRLSFRGHLRQGPAGPAQACPAVPGPGTGGPIHGGSP